MIAHRGNSQSNCEKSLENTIVENTIENFIKAIDNGVDGIETDLRLTKDNIIVLLHESSGYSSDSSDGEYQVNSIEYAELLKINPNIATLEELFNLCYCRKDWSGIINLELKEYNLTEILVAQLARYSNLIKRIVVSSFLHPAVWAVKKEVPKIKVGLLFRSYTDNFRLLLLKRRPDFLILSKDVLSFGDRSPLVSEVQKLIKWCNFFKINICIYTIKNIKEYNQLKRLFKIDYYISDFLLCY